MVVHNNPDQFFPNDANRIDDQAQRNTTWVAPPNLSFAETVTPLVDEAIQDIFGYHSLTGAQTEACIAVRESLSKAYRVVIAAVPPSLDRDSALRKIREAKTDAVTAISTGGKY